MSDTVLKERQDGVLILTLNRPKKKNAFSREQWQAFADALKEANDDQAVAAVLVTGAGGDFSSGTDLNDFTAAQGDEPHPFEACAEAVINFDKPLVCAAKGICIGGGATLMLHADIVYVGESLRMRFPFTNLGLVPEFGSSYLLAQIVGTRKAGEIMLLAEWMGAERAEQLDLVTARFSDEVLFEQALAKAKELAQWPINSLMATKRLLKATHRAGLLAALKAETEEMNRLGGSPENIEAVMAILEKRSPNFAQFRQ